MKKRYLYKISMLILVPTVMLFFNNCSDSGFQTKLAPGTAVDLSSTELDGKTLYNTNCSACHGPVETSTKLGQTAQQISKAISLQVSMKQLVFLTADQISAIALALNPPPEPPAPTTELTDYIPLTTNRYMLKSNFVEIFVADVNPDVNDANINTILDTLIIARPEAFGGYCTRNDTNCSVSCGFSGGGDCTGALNNSITASPTPIVSPVTQGYLVRACEEVLNVNKAVQTAALKAERNVLISPTLADMAPLMDFFFRGKPYDAASANALMTLVDQARVKSMPVLDQWRFLMLPLCVASASELL